MCENYRPISILPSLSKVFEKVMLIQLSSHFISNKLLYNSQCGFRSGHSTELAALEFVDRIAIAMDQGNTPVSIFLDLSKAFDSLDHKILVEKLKHYRVVDRTLNLCENYLKKMNTIC